MPSRKDRKSKAKQKRKLSIRVLEQDEREEIAKRNALRKAIEAGDSSGLAEGDVIGRLKMRIRRRAESAGAFLQ